MVTSPLGDIMISNDTETARNTKPAGNGKHDGTAEAPGRSSMNVNSRTAEAPGGSGMNVISRTAEAPGGSGMNDDSGTEEATGGSCKHVDSVTAETVGGSNKNAETAGDETHLADKQEETSSNGSLISANISEPGEIMIQGNGAQYQFQDSTVSDDYSMEHSPVTFPEEENDYLQDFLRRSEKLESNPPPTAYITPDIIRIHRTVILNELIPVFKDPVITDKHLQFIFVNEKGHDSQGLSRDVYAAFWEAFYLKYPDGEDFRIPVLSNELGDTELEAVGRIVLKGYMDLKYFPVRIAPAFFVAVCHGGNAVTPKILKNSFLSFLSSTDKDLLGHAFSGAEYDSNELIDLLDKFECRCLPQKDNLLSLILQIAHRVLIQEPKYAMDALQRVGQRIWRAEFSAVCLILQMYEQSEPTVRKVLALFSANPVSKDQNDSFKYLLKFVRGCNKEQLRHLLRFLTGSGMLCVLNIDVSFVVRCGADRVPTAYACGPVRELPSTYISYPDFRNEWESILQAKETWT